MIISLTTIPTRINDIELCINSLKNQGAPVHIFIPRVFKRKNITWDGHVPLFLKHPNITIHKVEDQGPITKLIYALNFDTDIIVTADDDNQYHPKWLKRLLNYSNKLPDAALCYRGRNFKDKNLLKYHHTKVIEHVDNPIPVDIITGVGGVLYYKKFFDKSFYNYSTIPEAYYVDDIWISGNLAQNNIPRYAIPSVGTKTLHQVRTIDALYHVNWKKSIGQHYNNKVIEHFKKYW